ncbi:hypothetical protein Pmani_034840 [Petrolisthes manimaculis]|uniref:Major facilitator superfamily (MFS) profile domain-containing protein n=1 Tax=Petrolisthes manimaculis TaxID=1843537 RepID=A0AAE1NP63_9EUCA|nr:hypothetical protein Pmani_034840 [Petrolisthes manimaculis]
MLIKKKKKEGEEEEEEKGNKTYLLYQTLTALSVGVGGLVSSVAMGYTSPALPSMRSDPQFDITQEQESWVGAVMPAAALVGSVMAGPLVDKFGRRTSLLHLTWPYLLSWVLIATSSTVTGVVLGRLLSGMCVGVQAVVGSVLMPEIVQLDLRNILMLFPAVFGNFGMLLSFWAGEHMSWRELAWLGCVLCVPLLPLLAVLPETPQHLTSTGRRSESLAVLLVIRRTPREAHEEQEVVDTSVKAAAGGGSEGGAEEGLNNTMSLHQVVGGANTWPLSVAAGLMLAQQTTGITAVVFFASSILGGGGAAVLLGVVNFIGTFLGIFAVALVPRRRLLVFSSFVVVGALVILSLHFWMIGGHVGQQEQDTNQSGVASYIPVIALLSYILGFAVGWGPVPWVFLGEGLPSAVRGKAAAGVVAVNWASAFIITKTFGWSLTSLGPHMTFLSYAVLTTLLFAFLYPRLPETYQQSSAAMDKLYLDTYAKKRE